MLSSGIGAGAVTTWCMLHGQSPGEAAVITVVSTITALVSMGPCSQHVPVPCAVQQQGVRHISTAADHIRHLHSTCTPQLPGARLIWPG
jgi:hypothetical protein